MAAKAGHKRQTVNIPDAEYKKLADRAKSQEKTVSAVIVADITAGNLSKEIQ